MVGLGLIRERTGLRSITASMAGDVMEVVVVVVIMYAGLAGLALSGKG